MGTKTQYFCDKCGEESQHRLRSYSLRSDGDGSNNVLCTHPQELCRDCQESLLDALAAWGHPASYERKPESR
jgi:hypothetical protein